jgi:hypothetical protein
MRKLRNLAAILVGAVAVAGSAYWFAVRPWWQDWGTDLSEATRLLPGDDVVPDAPVNDTRAITIEAPPSAVWPWLVQMGYGRGGWYSYDVIDMKGASADCIQPDIRPFAVGDIVPTHPGGGFEVKAVEPEHALVLYIDTALVRTQAEAARATAVEANPANIAAAGALMGATQPTEFAASWAFILEPLGDGRTRLIERFRARFDGGDQPWTKYTLPFMGFGVFVMVRKQMLGIKERVERTPFQPAEAA